jgi:hypothetical protein
LKKRSNYHLVKKLNFVDTPSINPKTDERFQKRELGILKEEFSPISHIGLGASFRVVRRLSRFLGFACEIGIEIDIDIDIVLWVVSKQMRIEVRALAVE